MKLLLLDIETAPNKGYFWGLFDQNIAINQIETPGYLLCWSAKWYGEEEVYFDSIHRNTKKEMLLNIYKLLEEADAVIHYNGTKFDIPTLNKEFVLVGLTPPAPYRQIDLYNTVRSQFKFTSNKLDYVSQQLGVGNKTRHAGMQMWLDCMAGDKEAWQFMEEYNIQDTLLLEKVYDVLRPWIRNHPNFAVYNTETGVVCPHCGSTHKQKRGFSYSNSYKYQRYQCQDCKAWFRDNHNIGHKKKAITNGV